MIDINQVQRDFDNGVMLCRETIRQVIELAASKPLWEAVAAQYRSPEEDGTWYELSLDEYLVATKNNYESRLLYVPLAPSKDSSCG